MRCLEMSGVGEGRWKGVRFCLCSLIRFLRRVFVCFSKVGCARLGMMRFLLCFGITSFLFSMIVFNLFVVLVLYGSSIFCVVLKIA